jgi:M6 family metalloprotease-like protein
MTKKLITNICICAALQLTLLCGALFSAPPRRWEFLKSKPKDFRTDYTLTPSQVSAMQSKGAIRRISRRGVISPTSYKILVIRVDFTGGPFMTKSSTDVAKFFYSLRDYFYENSYGVLTVTATVTTRAAGGSAGALGSYRLSSVGNYNDESGAALRDLLTDAGTAAITDYPGISGYDHIMVYHAGAGEEESQSSADLWSLFYPIEYTAGGKAFIGYTIVPDTSTSSNYSALAVICHEYGHQLGLLDLYDTSVTGGASTAGCWSLMDYPYGYYAGDDTGRYPPHLDPWSKNYLQFIDLNARTVNSVTPGAVLGDAETSPTTGFYKIPIEVASGNEYFVVEYRNPDATKNKFDLSLPTTGVLIWHIDDTIALDPARLDANDINTGTPHLAIDLVEADNVAITKYVPGKPGDAFRPGNVFTDPASRAFNGLSSGITIANFSFSAGVANFAITKFAVSGTVDVSKIINYPNPAGTGYFHPRSTAGTITTFSLQFTRPPREIVLSIYNIAGELVKRVAGVTGFNLKIGASSDYSWVYEYDWDGKNDNKEECAPGLYFYRVTADKEIKTSKMAIVR